MGELKELRNITPCADNNPYRELEEKAAKAAAFVGEGPVSEQEMTPDDAEKIIEGACSRIREAEDAGKVLLEELKKKEDLLEAVRPYRELHFDISKILHFKEVKFRFGRIPAGYYERLK